MIIKANSIDYTFKNPLFGYKTIIGLNIKWKKLSNNNYTYYDYGITFTARRCQFTIALTKTEALSFITIFSDVTKGRAADIQLTPGRGFHPFGADRGDLAAFKCHLINIKEAGSIGHPEDLFKFDCEILFNDPLGFPSYTPPSSGGGGQKYQGKLKIGTVENLRYPADMSGLDNQYNINISTTYNGTPYSNNLLAGSDSYFATLNIYQNESKTAELINYLVNTVRASIVEITPPDNAYMFGREKISTGVYGCRMVQDKIEITHNSYNNFSFPLSFFLEYEGE